MSERNRGIDLFRIIAMIFAVGVHIVGQGGVLGAAVKHSLTYETARFLDIIFVCCVDCFALISGYVGYGARFKPANILYFWLETFFYSVLITVIFHFITPGQVNGNAVLTSALPVLFRQYWYITAYFCLFFFMPAINALVRNASSRFTVYLIASSLILFSVFPSITGGDLFHTGRGYAPLWLAVMYGIGAACRKYPVLSKISPVASLVGFFACAAITWAVKRGIELADIGFLNKYVYHEYMVSYTAVTTVIASIFLLAFFSKIKPKRAGWISFTCPLVLGVYLLHVHPLIFGNLFKDLFIGLASLPAPVMALAVILCAVAVFAVCASADYLRLLLFNMAHARQFCSFLERKLSSLFCLAVSSKTDPE
ncbi:MAG: acyltransferase [Clostridia bacterium]|nr:acyltransferase [Clostridia bacterium]